MSTFGQPPSVTRKLLDRAGLHWTGPRRLSVINDLCGEYLLELHHQVQGRIAFLQKIKACTEAGEVCLIITSTDCDWTRGTYRRLVPANEVVAYLNRLYEDAEGPTSFHLCKPSSTIDFDPTSRDLALEAFEDGHPHCIYA